MYKVLIVDDMQSSRVLVSEQLRANGFDVMEAVDGDDAIARIQADLPDIVITDIVMPNKNGYELTRWIKSQPDTKHIPVIMCTSKGEEFDVYWGMKQGADAYVVKPYHPPDMLSALKKLLKKA